MYKYIYLPRVSGDPNHGSKLAEGFCDQRDGSPDQGAGRQVCGQREDCRAGHAGAAIGQNGQHVEALPAATADHLPEGDYILLFIIYMVIIFYNNIGDYIIIPRNIELKILNFFEKKKFQKKNYFDI